MSKHPAVKDILNYVVISDLHCGCQLGLCPPKIRLDEGGTYRQNPIQRKVWAYWQYFWSTWVPMVCRDEPYGIITNGDTIDGRHHGTVSQVTQNLSDQGIILRECLAPQLDRAAQYYAIRGTEAHVGPSGEIEEALARELGAAPNRECQYARYDLWKRVGKGLVHLLHHIGTTSSNAYESTTVHKELVEEYAEAARWAEEAPAVIVRSHRHRCIRTSIPRKDGSEGIAIVTPGWQGKTPFAWRMAGGRVTTPQFGGIVIRQGDEDLYVRQWVQSIGRTDEA